ncbi:MAG: PaaI family thioesterase [Chloroflexi bacterium]|nr:PaaI family thioesterase [Chloroflexota bacterium]MCH8893271.1 PaaI family thioesterase [Chloroflexota bacterium]MCI0788270.1 PaaI family thioesterase [Chloroflexota bacterium]MCI0811286.1 PaaI family thioesterase [Chloroflexota bacterium]MCI0899538.1 PaaI family thioesterase [Chloroflexota bacterium]
MATDPPPSPSGYVHESPFAELLDMRVSDPDDGSSTVVMPIKPGHLQQAGRVQGGIVVALADYAMYRAIRPLLKPGEGTTTIEIKVNFLAAAEKGELTATATIIDHGRRLIVGEMEVKDQDGKLIAQGLGTYLVLQPRNRTNQTSQT